MQIRDFHNPNVFVSEQTLQDLERESAHDRRADAVIVILGAIGIVAVLTLVAVGVL